MAQNEQVVYVERARDTLGLLALIFGAFGVLAGLGPAIFYIVPLACGGTALILGLIGRRRARQTQAPKGMAVAGIILGALALTLGIAGAVTVEGAISDFDKEMERIEQEFKNL